MNLKNYFSYRKRRGLSSIVGALLFVVLMVSTFAVLGVALNSQQDIASTNRDVAAKDLEKLREEFTMNAFTTGSPLSNTLNVEVNNLGSNPLEILSLTVTDNSGLYNTTRYNIPAQDSFIIPQDTKNILNSTNPAVELVLPTGANQTKTYTFQTISTLGNREMDELICDEFGCSEPVVAAGEGALSASLFLDGPNGINTKTSTIVMFVTNTSDEPVFDVQPINGFDGSDDCADFWWVDISGVTIDNGITEGITNCTVEPSTPQDLGPHETIIFKWDVTIGGDIGAEFEFCNRVQGDDLTPPLVTSIHSTTCNIPVENGAFDSLVIIDPNDCGGCGPGGEGGESIILIDDLLIRPSIFMVIPSPMGDADSGNPGDKVMFGVNVVNPTERPIAVNKVIMSVFAPGANNNDSLFLPPTGSDPNVCLAEDLSSFTAAANYWSCPGENQLMWKTTGDAVYLPPYSAETFMTKIKIGSAGRDLEGVLIQTSVFTTFGSFGKGNYQTTMASKDTATMSIYMSPTVDSLADADRQGNRQNIVHNEVQEFNIVLADTDQNERTWLDIGARFIVNVPREWAWVNVTNATGVIYNATQPSVEVFGDGSTQIIGTTTDYIGKCTDTHPCEDGERRAATISFEALPPNKNVDRLYIMYALADGQANVPAAQIANDYLFSSGPLNEIVLQVNSNQTGP